MKKLLAVAVLLIASCTYAQKNIDGLVLLKAEQNFIAIYKADKAKAYATYLSKQSILDRNGLYLATEKKTQSERIGSTPADIHSP